MPKAGQNLPPPSPIDARVYRVLGVAVMLDSDLAEVYGVETKAMNRAVKRNAARFPGRFAFQLTENEWDALRCQIGTLNTGRGQHRKYLPFVFTEHGAVMLATVLNSGRAIQASMVVVDAFVRLRHVLEANAAFARKLDELAARVDTHDRAFAAVFEELKRLTGEMEPEPPRGRIGFKPNRERGASGKRRGK